MTDEVEIGSDVFKNVMGHFCTGVVIVTALRDGLPVGLTCQSFVSVSLSPPLVSFCPATSSTSWPAIRDAGKFCVNVLADDQRDLCDSFAKSGGDKFAGVKWSTSKTGSPSIDGCLAHIDCSIEFVHPAGDHDIVVGLVNDLYLDRDGKPLLFYKGKLTALGSA